MAGGAFYARVGLGADRRKGAWVQLPIKVGSPLPRVPA
jgi:hypothetical protein